MSELDKIKTTITISLGLKNRLREIKGNLSYEEYLAQSLRTRNELVHNNRIELSKFSRKQSVYTFEGHKIVFSHNVYNRSQSFQFDIKIDLIRDPIWGKPASYEDFLSFIGKNYHNYDEKFICKKSYELYFSLLIFSIQQEIESLFNHKGRIEDHYRWKKEFESLNLSTDSFEADVMEKLQDMQEGVTYR